MAAPRLDSWNLQITKARTDVKMTSNLFTEQTTPDSAAGSRSATPSPFRFGDRTAKNFSFSSPQRSVVTGTQESLSDHTQSQDDERPTNASGRDLTVPLFRFAGQQGSDVSESSPFSFRSLYNMTPMPSPRASPRCQGYHTPPCFESSDSGKSRGASPNSSAGGLSPPSFSLAGASSDTSPLLADRMDLLSIQPRSSVGEDLSSILRRIPQEGHRDVQSAIVAVSKDAPPDGTAPEPYNIRDEAGPEHEFFTSKFQSDMHKGVSIAKDLVVALKDVGAMDELDVEGQMLLTESQDATSFQGSDTRRIAVLGDSGEGKSTLINSLLHFPGIAQTGDIGSACTSVVTEYRHRRKKHTSPITIEAEYLSSGEVESMVRELLWSYRQPYLPLVESSDISEQDYNKYQRESEYAWSALNAAFGHHRTFNKEMLRDMSDGAEDRITDQFLRWAKDIRWPEGAESGKWTSTAATADECCTKTRIFMQDKIWPFTKIIRVYISAQILKTGIVLADLPGLQDTNLARVRATQDYLMNCDNIFIVTKIQRAITDQSVKSSLYWVLSRHAPVEWEASGAKNLKLAVVCTRSEDINIKGARTEFCGDGKRIGTDKITDLEREIEDAKEKNDRVRKKAAKRKLEFLLIGARNEHVKEGLKKAYASEAPGGNLEVFCVSNTVYEKHCRKGTTEYVEASGIPELRRFCHSVSADAQLKEARHFLHSSLSHLLTSTGIWANSHLRTTDISVQEFSGPFLSSVRAVSKEASQSVARLREDFMDNFDEQVMKLFSSREALWGKAAVTEARSWENWHWSKKQSQFPGFVFESMSKGADANDAGQYNAWCLKDGIHSTPKRGHVNWNRDMIWKMHLETDFAWDMVIDDIRDVFKALTEKITSALKRLQKRIIDSSAASSLAALASGIGIMIQSWEYKISLEEAAFHRGVKAIQRRSTDSHANSYIQDDMMPHYRAARLEKGTGKAGRQKSIVGGHISEDNIFPCMAIRLQSEMAAVAKETEEKLRLLVKEMMKRLRVDVNMALNQARIATSLGTRGPFDREAVRVLSLKVGALKQRLAAIDPSGK